MEADVDGLVGAGRHERSGERTTWRNGYRDRSLDTRLGTLNLRVPKLRQGSYFPGFLEARKTSEQALVAVIQEAWIGGVSTRRVDELVQAMGLSGISKSTVSKLCKDIDERVGEFLNRPLTGEWPYVWLDATYLKVRQGGRIVPVAAIIAVAANTEGRREIIGLGIGPSEAETFWTEFLRSLKARGLGGVRLVISAAHTGLKAAIARVFEATWQRCRVHWMRNALAHVSRGQHTVVAAAIRQAFDQPDRAHAGETWRKVAATPDNRTYGFFQKNVVSEYTHEKAVADKVNVGNEIYLIETEITQGGETLKAEQLVEKRERESRARRWETQDDEQAYAATQLDRSVVNPDQIRTVIRTFHDKWPEIFPAARNCRKP
jgi:transposase-like protein